MGSTEPLLSKIPQQQTESAFDGSGSSRGNQADTSVKDVKIEISSSCSGRRSVSSISHSSGTIARPTSASECLLYQTNHSSKYLAETVWGVRQMQPTSEGELPTVSLVKEEQHNLHNKLDNIRQVSLKDLNNIFEEEEEKNEAEREDKEDTSCLNPTGQETNLKPSKSNRLTLALQRSLSSFVNKCACGTSSGSRPLSDD